MKKPDSIEPKYWVNTVSKDHVLLGVAGGFTQANHGSPQGLKRMRKGDYIVFYSSKTSFKNGEPLQAFTALGQITDEEPYQFRMSENFVPYRRNVNFMKCHEALIRPLIPSLEFIGDKQKWGYKFRFGLFEIPKSDFLRIAEAMHKVL